MKVEIIREPLFAMSLIGALSSGGGGESSPMAIPVTSGGSWGESEAVRLENVGASSSSELVVAGFRLTHGRFREHMDALLQPVIFGKAPRRPAKHFELAERAVRRMGERQSEDVSEWARVLAGDSVRLSD